MTITEIVNSKAFIIFSIVAAAATLLYYSGIFKIGKRVLFDWAFDHKAGRFTINNGARILALFTLEILLIGTHFDLQLKPHFHITPIPLTEWELGMLLAFIIGAEWVKKPNLMPVPDNKTEVKTEGTTIINTAPQAAKPAVTPTKTEPVVPIDSEVLKAETKPEKG